MSDRWKDLLGTSLTEAVEIASSISIEDLSEDDRARLDETREILSACVEELAVAVEARDESAQRRILATIGILRETVAQHQHLSDVMLSSSLLKVAAKVGDLGLRMALQLASNYLIRPENT